MSSRGGGEQGQRETHVIVQVASGGVHLRACVCVGKVVWVSERVGGREVTIAFSCLAIGREISRRVGASEL